MGKTRIHDLAAEFGIESAQLISMLADMDIHVRSHMSGLAADQVALVRARWEREKRRVASADKKKKKKTTRRRASKKTDEPAEAPALPKRPRRRRRTAAEVAARAATEEPTAAVVPTDEPVEEPTVETSPPEAVETVETKPVDAETPEVAAEEVVEAVEAVEEPQEEEKVEEAVEAVAVEPIPEQEAVPEPEPEPDVVEEVVEAEVEAELEPSAEIEEPPTPEELTAPVEAVETPVEEEPAKPAKPIIPRRVERAPTPPPQQKRKRPAATTPAGPRPVASAAPGEVAEERRRDRKRRKRNKRDQVDREAVKANINRTLASMKGPGKRSSRRRIDTAGQRELEEARKAEEKERERTTIRVNEFITVSELATTLETSPTEIVTFCFKELGLMVTVNQRLDFDQIDLIAGEFGFKAVREEEYIPDASMEAQPDDVDEDLQPRSPVVTVMGHVDHGKTSLLDYIRETNVMSGEAGGITQHIGAYHFALPNGRMLTFLDTPGHEAFTAMRARGAQVTDIVVLVVAADDRVMPQTIEAISHAKSAGVPLLVAINKIDLPGVDPERVKQDLLKHEVLLEEFGGETMCALVSAKTGKGIDDLLDKLLLQADLLDIKANPDRLATGNIVEGTLDPGKGPVATVLVKNGTLRVGDNFICGNLAGRVRAMIDERGQRVKEAGPAIPVQVLGFSGVPHAGDTFSSVAESVDAREIAQKRQRLDREAEHRRTSKAVSLEDLSKQIEVGEASTLKVIIKADQGGPAEALADAFAQLSTDEVKVEVVHRGVGAISEGDVILAKAAGAVIIGFHVRPDGNARTAAEREKVDIRTYRVIYDAVEDLRSALEGMLSPEEKETVVGEAEVREPFKISGVGTIAGSYVRFGTVRRGLRIRVVRDGIEIYDGAMSSLKRFKDDVKEVKEGLECGIGVENFNDIKVGDILEAYEIEKVARTLETTGAQKDE
ncbi:MAG: translation initiation factor IF-2 [Myxococcota bacterium]|nr:translation initiation factor IF-2 [Myxococcota bacterium]